MFKRIKFLGLLSATLMFSAPLLADQQALKVEEILSKKNSLKIDLSLSYSNIDQKTGVTSVVPVQTLLSYIYVPVYAGDQVVDQDILVSSLNVKYGVTSWLELVAFADAHSTTSRVKFGTTLANQSDTDFDRAGIGFTAKVKDEGSTPAFLVGATANVISRVLYAQKQDGALVGTEKRDEMFDTYSFYALSYYTVDPIVFVLKASYQWSLEQTYQDSTIDRPDLFTFSPEIYFAVNPYTNLSWGVMYMYQGEQTVDGQQETNAESAIGFSIGMSYEIVRNNILSIQASQNNSSSYGQSNITVMYSKRF